MIIVRFLRSNFVKYLVTCLLISLPFVVLADEKTLENCLNMAETQFEMNQCEQSEFEKADAELNRIYQKIRKLYADDPVFLQKLRDTQRLWIQFRDAELEMKFPHSDEPRYYYGSVYPMCFAGYKANLTTERVATLKQWLEGTEEGDVCAGSIKRPEDLQPPLHGR